MKYYHIKRFFLERRNNNLKKKVLDILGEPIVNGGQESFILNMYNNMDLSKIQIDVLTPFYCENNKFKENIEKNGGKVFIGNLSFTNRRKENFRNYVEKFLRENKYEIVHIQSGSIYSLMIGAQIAKKAGIKKIIVHSHCGGFKNIKYLIIKKISNRYLLKYPTDYWACSELAAKWKFPKKIIKEKKYKILKNAIDTDKIYFSKKVRENKRKELLIDDKLVFGHIGRFSIQKNHEFLIEIFNEIHKKNKNSILLLIGTGELEDIIREKVKELELSNSVKFLGVRNDINELLNAMDVFLLPSFFEGLPVVGVEAQATGLPVFTSDKVTKELPISELSFYYSLKLSAEKWSENILNEINNIKRINTTNKIKEKGYDVKLAAKLMQKYYEENMEK